MADKEKVALIKQMLNDLWETLPENKEDHCGVYYGILTAIGSVIFMKGENDEQR